MAPSYNNGLFVLSASASVSALRIRGGTKLATQMSKSQLVDQIATKAELSKRDVKSVLELMTEIGHKELKKNGVFLVPGFARFVVIKKPAQRH